MKILHVLYQSLPQVSGSSIRSRDILLSQTEIGLNVLAITSPFQNSISGEKEDFINQIRYIRTSKSIENSISDQKKSVLSRLARMFSIIPFTFKLYKTIKNEKPDIIHAHAMFFCGLPAIFIGRITRTPVVYEFRSLWMFQKKNKKDNKTDYFFDKWLLKMEIFTLMNADCSVFLNESLRDYFLKKGCKFSNSVVVNNAVNTTLINSVKSNKKNEKRALVFGYIGTLTDYEGIEFLVESFQDLYDEGIKNKLIIYGDGISKKSVVEKIQNRPDIETIEYKGSVLPENISTAFSEIDVIVNPRLSTDVTNSVTPLKPLEAFAYDKIVVGSDVGGILELVQDEVTGFTFKAEDKNDLNRVIKRVINLSDLEQNRITKEAFNYVITNKSWLKNAERYCSIYKDISNLN